MLDNFPWLILLQVIISCSTIAAMWLLGQKSRYGWFIHLSNQGLWLAFIFWTQTWGLLPLNAAMWFTSYRGWRRWEPEPAQANLSVTLRLRDRASRRMRNFASQIRRLRA